jgi:hypothetical protein
MEIDGDAVTSNIRDDQGEGQKDKGKGEIKGYDVVVQDGKSVLVLSSTAAEQMQE